jgi:hypothetical protein
LVCVKSCLYFSRLLNAIKHSGSIISDNRPANVETSLTASISFIPNFIKALLGKIRVLIEL